MRAGLVGAVVIDGTKCVSCRMCATFCPTGAIAKFDDADGTLGVTHTPGDCVKCGSCRDVCPADAITLLDAVSASWLTGGNRHRYVMTPRPREPYRQPPPDPRHLPSRFQRRHLRTVGEPQRSPRPSAQGAGEPLTSRPSMASRRSPHGGDGIVVRRTSDFSAKQERPHLPTAPALAPAATRPQSAQPPAPLSSSRRRGRFMPRANAG